MDIKRRLHSLQNRVAKLEQVAMSAEKHFFDSPVKRNVRELALGQQDMEINTRYKGDRGFASLDRFVVSTSEDLDHLPSSYAEITKAQPLQTLKKIAVREVMLKKYH